ncbi:hypothetical protein ACFX2A_046906 [Malus domestica]
MRFKCVHESWRDLIDSRFVASHLSNSNNSRSSARIAVRHIVGGEEDDKEDVLGEEVEEELDQWAEEMGESQAKAMKLNLHPLLEQCEEEEEEVVGPCPDQGEWSSLSDLLHCHRLHKL